MQTSVTNSNIRVFQLWLRVCFNFSVLEPGVVSTTLLFQDYSVIKHAIPFPMKIVHEP